MRLWLAHYICMSRCYSEQSWLKDSWHMRQTVVKRTRTIDSTFLCFQILQLVLSTIASCSCLLVSCRSSRSLLCAPSPSGPWAGLHCYWITAGIIIYLHHHVIRLLTYSSLPHHCNDEERLEYALSSSGGKSKVITFTAMVDILVQRIYFGLEM